MQACRLIKEGAMRCGKSVLLLVFALLSLGAASSWGETSQADRDEQARVYIRILLELSKTSAQKAESLEIESEKLKQKSENLMTQLLQVQAELTKASASVEKLNEIAEALGISPDHLDKILPLLEQQAEAWRSSLESAQSETAFWRLVSLIVTVMAIIGFVL